MSETKKPKNYRFSPNTLRRLTWLARKTGRPETEILETAVQQVFDDEWSKMRSRLIPGKKGWYDFEVDGMEVQLILHADHELNASTFAARVIASTMSDVYSAVTGAIGALKGRLHGGANEDVINMLDEIGTPARAESYVKEKLAQKVKIPGFGHRVYKTHDPRAIVLRKHAEQLVKGNNDLERTYETALKVEVKRRPPVDTRYPGMRVTWQAACTSCGCP